ncbi:hypothetical protein ACFV4F_08310, partial [Kitasatospora sp. NPDC059722]|uniref:hypothetical protein n=1 Tax=Kitasatospora sp. NPDC059722 TaxID=3346925 RepID=UPI0036CD044C
TQNYTCIVVGRVCCVYDTAAADPAGAGGDPGRRPAAQVTPVAAGRRSRATPRGVRPEGVAHALVTALVPAMATTMVAAA